jgi:hypothetical protein
MDVSLVRVESVWFVFADARDAWAFYKEWRDDRDCEVVLEQGVIGRDDAAQLLQETQETA